MYRLVDITPNTTPNTIMNTTYLIIGSYEPVIIMITILITTPITIYPIYIQIHSLKVEYRLKDMYVSLDGFSLTYWPRGGFLFLILYYFNP